MGERENERRCELTAHTRNEYARQCESLGGFERNLGRPIRAQGASGPSGPLRSRCARLRASGLVSEKDQRVGSHGFCVGLGRGPALPAETRDLWMLASAPIVDEQSSPGFQLCHSTPFRRRLAGGRGRGKRLYCRHRMRLPQQPRADCPWTEGLKDLTWAQNHPSRGLDRAKPRSLDSPPAGSRRPPRHACRRTGSGQRSLDTQQPRTALEPDAAP